MMLPSRSSSSARQSPSLKLACFASGFGIRIARLFPHFETMVSFCICIYFDYTSELNWITYVKYLTMESKLHRLKRLSSTEHIRARSPDPKPILRAASLIAMLAGAVGSVGLMLYAGRHNSSRLLLVLFALWVLSPFVVLAFAKAVSNRWSALTGATLHIVTLFLTLGSLAIYGYVALGPPRARPAPFFVIVPPASWLLIAIVVSIAALISARTARRPPPTTGQNVRNRTVEP